MTCLKGFDTASKARESLRMTELNKGSKCVINEVVSIASRSHDFERRKVRTR